MASNVAKTITDYICGGGTIDRKLQIKICEVHLQEHIPGSSRLLWCWKILSGIQTGSKNVHSDFDLLTQMLTDPRVGKSTQVEYHVQEHLIDKLEWDHRSATNSEHHFGGTNVQGKILVTLSACVMQAVAWCRTEYSFELGDGFQAKKYYKIVFEIVCGLCATTYEQLF